MPDDSGFELVGLTDGVDETVRVAPDTGRRRPARRLPGPRRRSLAPDHRQRPSHGAGAADHRALHHVAERLPAPRLRRGCSGHAALPAEQGAAALCHEQGDRPDSPHRARARASATGASSACSARRADRQDDHRDQPRGRARDRGPKTFVVDLDLQFGDVGLCLGPGRRRRSTTSSRRRQPRRGQDRGSRCGTLGSDALLAPTRPDQASAVTTSSCATSSVAARELRLRDRRHGSRVLARSDRGDRRASHSASSACSTRSRSRTRRSASRRSGRWATRPDESRSCSTVPTRASASRGRRRTVLGRSPDMLVPSDRAIPRALTDGNPIYEADPKSGAAIVPRPRRRSSSTTPPTGQSRWPPPERPTGAPADRRPLQGELNMELHERLVTDQADGSVRAAGATRSRRSRTGSTCSCQRSRAAAAPAGDRPGGSASAPWRRSASSLQRAELSRSDRERLAARSATTCSATGRSSS